MSNAILYRMPSGIPGAVSRQGSATLEPNLLAMAIAFGSPVKLVAGSLMPIETGDVAGDIHGFLVRPYPTQSAEGMVVASAEAGTVRDVMRRGYMTVLLASGTAARRGPVNVRVTAGSGREPGAIEAAADGANTVVVAGAYFMGEADANGNVEIEFNI